MAYKDKEKAREYNARYQRELRQFSREHGICVICNKEKADSGYKTCLACRMGERDRAYYSYSKTAQGDKREEYLRKKTEQGRQRRLEFEKAGMCNVCGKRKPVPYRKRCEYCNAKYNNSRNRKRERDRLEKGLEPISMFGQQGYCSMCGKPVVKGKKVCQYHYERCMVSVNKMNEVNRDRCATKGHTWNENNKLLFTKFVDKQQ